MQGVPPLLQVFDLYDILNKFCTNVPYLDFGVFHKESLHKAFLVRLFICSFLRVDVVYALRLG